MDKYHFYYDETEHSRTINHQTVSAENYYDGFVTTVLGWKEQDELEIERRFSVFKQKHFRRMTRDEFKSTTIKQKQLERGFASFNKDTAIFIKDFLDLFDEKIFIYISVFSKMEYVIKQVFSSYKNSSQVDMNLLKYSIIKAIVVYHPEEVISSIYDSPSAFLIALRRFLQSRIRSDKANTELKKMEIYQFKVILFLLDGADKIESFDWNYRSSLVGLELFLKEKSISESSLVIDQEARTFASAKMLGFSDVSEGESKQIFALQMADLLAGLVAKFMKALSKALKYQNSEDEVKKKLLDEGWFNLTDERFELYRSFYRIVMRLNEAWYKTYSGLYADDLICFTNLLAFINDFSSAEDLKSDLNMMPEYFNTAVCNGLNKHYSKIQHKPPVAQTKNVNYGSLHNSRGTRDFFDL